MTSDEIIDEITKSGLRGRGGGGFPTGLKWNFTYRAEGEQNMSHVTQMKVTQALLWIGLYLRVIRILL